jgi:hypothetical protein
MLVVHLHRLLGIASVTPQARLDEGCWSGLRLSTLLNGHEIGLLYSINTPSYAHERYTGYILT